MDTCQYDQDVKIPGWREVIPLTPRERALLRLVVQGHGPEQAAGTLGVTPAEAHDTLDRLQVRCGALGRRALVVRAVLEGWVG